MRRSLWTTSDPRYLLFTDRKATNGSFVNGKKVVGAIRLHSGDSVQLGIGGPSFTVTTDPAPPAATTEVSLSPPTTEVPTGGQPQPNFSSQAPPSPTAPGKQGVGQQTLVTEIRKAKRSTLLIVAVPVAIIAVLAVGAFTILNRANDQTKKDVTAEIEGSRKPEFEEVLAGIRPSVARITTSFTLSEKLSSRPYVLAASKGSFLFLRGVGESGDIVTVPLMVTETSPYATNRILSFETSGTGFAISANELVTNKHVAEPWKVALPSDGLATSGTIIDVTNPSNIKEFTGATNISGSWDPNEVDRLIKKALGEDRSKTIQGKKLTELAVTGGTVTYEVTFANRQTPIMGSLISSSEKHDVSILQVAGMPAPALKTLDNYEEIKPGARVFIVGNPASAPGELMTVKKADRGGESNVKVDNPVAVSGTVANILRSEGRRANELGDAYSLSLAQGAGAGMSGGPLCDMDGNVIGVYYRQQIGGLSFAIPIRYAMEIRATAPN